MNVRSFLAATAAAIITVAGANAEAATIHFGAAPWNAAHNLESYSVGGVTADADPLNAKLYHTAGVGLGVNFGILPLDPGEIETIETLTISFSQPTVLKSFTVTQLVAGERTCLPFVGCGRPYNEQGAFTLSNGFTSTFQALNADGSLTVEVGGGPVSWIRFAVPNVLDIRHDYSVLSIETVPEPAALVMLGLAMVGGAARLRRRR